MRLGTCPSDWAAPTLGLGLSLRPLAQGACGVPETSQGVVCRRVGRESVLATGRVLSPPGFLAGGRRERDVEGMRRSAAVAPV